MDELKRILINAGILKEVEVLTKEFTKKSEKNKEILKEGVATTELNEDGSNYNEWVVDNMENQYKEKFKKFMNEYGERKASDPKKVKAAAALFNDLSEIDPNDEESQKAALQQAADKYGVKAFEVEKVLGGEVGVKTKRLPGSVIQNHKKMFREEGEPSDIPTPSLNELKKNTLK